MRSGSHIGMLNLLSDISQSPLLRETRIVPFGRLVQWQIACHVPGRRSKPPVDRRPGPSFLPNHTVIWTRGHEEHSAIRGASTLITPKAGVIFHSVLRANEEAPQIRRSIIATRRPGIGASSSSGRVPTKVSSPPF